MSALALPGDSYIRNVDVMQHNGEWWMVIGAGTGAIACAPLSREVTEYTSKECAAVFERMAEERHFAFCPQG